MAGPNIWRMNGLRTKPSPRSPESAPPTSVPRRRGQGRLRAVGVAKAAGAQVLFERRQARRQVFLSVAVELAAERSPRITLDVGVANAVERGVLACEIENRFIHHLDC